MANDSVFAGDITLVDNKSDNNTNNRDIFGDITLANPNEKILSQGSEDNRLNKIKEGINKFLGLQHDHDYLKLIAIQEGKSYDDILKEFNLAQMNDFQATVGEFFHQLTFGVLNNPAEFESTGNTLEDIGFASAQTLSGGLGMLASFGAAGKSFDIFGKTMKYISAGTKLDKVLSNISLVRNFAKIDWKANLFYRMAKTGATFGLYNAVDSFMQNNTRYNDYYDALNKATPDALQGFFFGLGIPLLGSETYNAFSKLVQDSKLGKAIVSMGLKDAANVTKPLGAVALQGVTSQVFQGTNSLTQIYDGLKDKSPMRVIGALMNVMFSAAIGLGAYDYSKYPEMNKYENPQPKLQDINELKAAVNDLSEVAKVYDESIKLGNNIKFTETLKNELSDTTKPEDVKLVEQAISDAQKRTVSISKINEDNVIVTTKNNNKTYQEELKKPETIKDEKMLYNKENSLIGYNSKKQNHPQYKEIALNILGNYGYKFNNNDIDGLIRGNVPIINVDGKKYVFGLNNKFYPFIKKSVQKTSKENVVAITKTVGDKYNAVNLVNKLINKHREVFKKADAYFDPYGGSLIYLNNLDILKNTDKPIYINVSKKFEPYKYKFYKELQSDNNFVKETKKVIQKMIEIAKKYKDKTKAKKETREMLSNYPLFKEVFSEYISENYPAERIKNMEKSFDSFVKTLRKKNVYILDKEDVDFFKFVSNHINDGKKVVLFDDSDYANLDGENVESVYGDTTNVNKLVDRKKDIYDKIYNNNGIIVTQNQISPKYMDWLDKYNPNLYTYGHWSQWGKHTEYGNISPFSPEFIGIIKKGVEGNGREFSGRRQVLEGSVSGAERRRTQGLSERENSEVYRNGGRGSGDTYLHKEENTGNGTKNTGLLDANNEGVESVDNYLQQFKQSEKVEPVNNTDELWFLGGTNIKYAWDKTVADIKSKTVPFDKPKTNIIKTFLVNPFAWQYLKDPILREMGKAINEAKFKVEMQTMKFREPMYDVADGYKGLYDSAKKKVGKDYKGFVEAVGKAIVDGNRQSKNPNDIFLDNGKYLEYKDLASEIFKKHKEFYDVARKKLNEFMEKTLSELEPTLGEKTVSELRKYMYAEIEKRPYFMPQEREVGNVHIVVRDLDGKVIERYHEFDPTALLLGRSYKAKKIIDEMKKKYGADNIIYEVKEPEPLDVTKLDALNLLNIINNVVDNTDITPEQKQQVVDNVVKEIKAKGFMSHTIHRSQRDIKGYIEDPMRAMQLYLKQSTSFVNKQSLKWELNKIEEELSHKWGNNVKTAFKWHKEQLLSNKTVLDKVVGYTRSFLFMRYLGLNFKNAFVNITFQPPITIMHLIAELGGKNVLDPAKATTILNGALKDLATGKLTDREKQVLDTLDKLGVTTDQRNQFMLGQSALIAKTWNSIMEKAGLFMKYTEIPNRKSAALAYLRVHPELTGDEAVAKTRDFVYTTNGKYGDSELAIMFQGKGALKSLGKVGQTFQSYNHQILLGFLKLYNEKQYGAILFGAGALMFMGGLRLLPLYDTVKSEYTRITGRDLEVDLHKRLNNGVMNFLLNGGLFGNLPFGLATDVSSSAGFQLPTDELSFSGKGIGDILMSQFFGVGYSTAKDFGKSLNYLSSGDLNKAVYYSPLPRVLTYPFKALQEYKWGLTTNGDLIIDDPITGKPMKATQQEALLQSIGFTPERISEFKNLYYSYKTLSQYYSQKRKQLLSEYKVAMNNGDKDKMIDTLKQMKALNDQIKNVNSDYGMGISYVNIHNMRSVYSNKSMRDFLYNNLGGK